MAFAAADVAVVDGEVVELEAVVEAAVGMAVVVFGSRDHQFCYSSWSTYCKNYTKFLALAIALKQAFVRSSYINL